MKFLYDRVSPRPSCPMIPEISVKKSEKKETSDSELCSTKPAESLSALGSSESQEVTAGTEPMHLDTELGSVSKLSNGSKEPSPLENPEADHRVSEAAGSVEHGVDSTFVQEISVSENGSGSTEGDGSTGLREEMVDVDVIDGELSSSTVQENGVHCNGKAPGRKESPSQPEEHADDQVVSHCPSSPEINSNPSKGE